MLLELLRTRRSIRQFQKKPVEQDKIDILIEAMLRSPSSRSLNPWEFIVITNPDTIGALARSKTHGSSFMKNAALAVVVCADPEKSDVWVEDTSIAALILHLTATDLGLGSCWVQIRKRQHDEQTSAEAYIRNLLDLDNRLVVEAIVAVGYPAEQKPGHDRATLLYDRVFYERYGKTE